MTREEDIWLCRECLNLKGRHDLWFEGDICEDCHEDEETQSVTDDTLSNKVADVVV